MDVAQVQEVSRQCAARVLAPKRQPTERVYRGQGFGRTDLIGFAVEGSEFLPPLTLAEWLDDMLSTAAQWRGPWTPTLLEIAEAARVSERAAVAAVSGARNLIPWDAWHLYAELRRWHDEAQRLPSELDLAEHYGAADDDQARGSRAEGARPGESRQRQGHLRGAGGSAAQGIASGALIYLSARYLQRM